MFNQIVTQTEPKINISPWQSPLGTLLAADPILHIRLFDKRGKWQLEVVFIGGSKVTGLLTADEVAALESDLADQGWQVDASLFSRGFNAKPALVDDCGMIFASSAGMWPDDLGLQEATI